MVIGNPNRAITTNTATITNVKKVIFPTITCALIFIAIAVAQFNMYMEVVNPYVVRSGDGANILSFVAARVNPELFTGDALLSNLQNFAFYHTAGTMIVAYFSNEMALTYLSLIIPVVILHGLGFWWLCSKMGFGMWASIVASVAFLATVPAIEGTYWGGFVDPQPRFHFQSVFPIILCLAWIWRDKPRFWPIIMAVCGLATYLHSVSGPPVALGILMGLFFLKSKKFYFGSHLGWAVVAGLVYCLFISVFATNFINSTGALGGSVDQEFLISVARDRFASPYMNPMSAISSIIENPWSNWGNTIVALFAFGGATLLLMVKKQTSPRNSFLVYMVFAFIVSTIALPLLEVSVSLSMGHYPLQIDFVRSSRFLIPIILLLALSVLLSCTNSPNSVVNFSLVSAVSIFWIAVNPTTTGLGDNSPLDSAQKKILCIVRSCEIDNSMVARRDLYRFLRDEIPQGSPIYSADGDIAIRYAALKPITFSDKDGGAFIYAKQPNVRVWYRNYQTWKSIGQSEHNADQIINYIKHAISTRAAYAVLPAYARNYCELEPIFLNDQFVVIKLTDGTDFCSP